MKTIVCANLCLLAIATAHCQPATYLDANGNAIATALPDGAVELSQGRATASPVATRTNNRSTSAPGEGLYESYVVKATESWPEAVAIGDLNNDGLNDVAMCTSMYFSEDDNTLFVFLQNLEGDLMVPVKYRAPVNRAGTLAIGDFNGDSLNDVVVGGNDSAGIFYQNSGGTLNPITFFNPGETRYVNSGDFNSDGRDDIVAMNWGSGSVRVSLQNSSGEMNPATPYTAGHAGYDELEVGDLNNDGRDDIIAMSGQAYAVDNVAVLRQGDSGTMLTQNQYDLGADINSSGIGVGDVTGDGRSDLVLGYSANVAVFAQEGSGFLDTTPVSYPSAGSEHALEVADVNRDGLGDVIAAHGGISIGVLTQSSSGVLNPEFNYDAPYATRYNPHGLAVGDINRDGGLDIVTANYNYGLVIHYHTPVHTAADNTWGLYE